MRCCCAEPCYFTGAHEMLIAGPGGRHDRMMVPRAASRLRKELEQLNDNPGPGISATPLGDGKRPYLSVMARLIADFRKLVQQYRCYQAQCHHHWP